MLHRSVIKPVRFVFYQDSAVDQDGTDYAKFLEDGCDHQHLKIKEGEKPSVFILRQLTHKQRIAANRFSGADQHEYVVKCGLVGVENYVVHLPDGDSRSVPPPERRKINDEIGEQVTDKWLSDSMLTPDDLSLMSMVIVAISEAKLPLLGSFATAFGVGT